ncbi:MAG: hypothetical protein MUF13_08890, partial [Akkermansiaceae bacterium]|nr:hypothetical protein [Akkermansiaceae bacterium]
MKYKNRAPFFDGGIRSILTAFSICRSAAKVPIQRRKRTINTKAKGQMAPRNKRKIGQINVGEPQIRSPPKRDLDGADLHSA